MKAVPYPEAARTLLRGTLLDAVDDLVRDRGWASTTMSDVAAAAGVSRQTVYNEFGSRQAVAEAYVLREIDVLLTAAEATVRENAHDARAALSGAFALFLQLASDEPLIKTIVAGQEEGGLLTLLTAMGRDVATGRLGALIVATWPQVGAVDAELLAETIVRLGISHALLPVGASDATAAAITRVLGPFIDELVS